MFIKRGIIIGIAALAAAVLLWNWTGWLNDTAVAVTSEAVANTVTDDGADGYAQKTSSDELAIATFAGGCFWCVESTLEKVDGVREVVSGYTGGRTTDPTYRQVGRGGTGHTEAVQVYYDPNTISYRGLLHYFWREVDPTDSAGQFVDRGDMYRPAIYYHNDYEKQLATETRDALEASGRYSRPLTIEIAPAETFYEAEGYHQNYYKTNAQQYKFYRYGSGRDQFLQRVWGEALYAEYVEPTDEDVNDGDGNSDGAQHENENAGSDDGQTQYYKPADTEIKTKLNDMQYSVTQHEGTEPPYRNEYWDNKQSGIYVDIVSGEPLFSSADKYKSNTGWPSFTRPLDEQFIVEKTDYKLVFPRVEVRSKYGDSHLGHIFKDGPAPTGLRYCINSAALRFVAKNELSKEGYGKYATLFE